MVRCSKDVSMQLSTSRIYQGALGHQESEKKQDETHRMDETWQARE